MGQFEQSEESIFDLARRIDNSKARTDYLDQACGPSQRQRVRVEELLKSYEEEQSFLEQPPKGLAQTVETGCVNEKAGDTIGPYKLLQRIGEGGFGVVYMAEQTKPIRRKVALKVIKPGMDTKEVIARFEAERQTLALMDHPNIAKVLDGGETESGRPYFVMELVNGIPLTKFCDDQKLGNRERLALFQTVCSAIQHAHQKGVIHRDIKPSNIMITLHDGQPVPKVIDFGVSKAINQRMTERTLFTAYGQMVGTPQYMSPEQAEMSGLDVDTRSDIYSLGVLLYELLTGTTPLELQEIREIAFAEMQRLIREEEPPKPSTRVSVVGEWVTTAAKQRGTSVDAFRRSLKGDLDWIVMKALEKDRNRRYDTAIGVAKDIQRCLEDKPVEAGPPTVIYRTRKFIDRNRGLVSSVACVTAALFMGLILAFINFRQAQYERDRLQLAYADLEEAKEQAEASSQAARNARDRALDQKKRADSNAARAESQARRAKLFSSTVMAMLKNHDALLGSFEGNEEETRRLERLLTEVEASSVADAADRSEILESIAEAYLRSGEFQSAGISMDRVIAIAKSSTSEERERHAGILVDRSWNRRSQNRSAAAFLAFYALQLLAEDTPDAFLLARAHAYLVHYMQLGAANNPKYRDFQITRSIKDPVFHAEKAIAIIANLTEKNQEAELLDARVHHWLAGWYRNENQLEKAERLIAIALRKADSTGLEKGWINLNAAKIQFGLGNWTEFKKHAELARRILGGTPYLTRELAASSYLLGDHKQAALLLISGLSDGNNRPWDLVQIAEVLNSQGDVEQASTYYDWALTADPEETLLTTFVRLRKFQIDGVTKLRHGKELAALEGDAATIDDIMPLVLEIVQGTFQEHEQPQMEQILDAADRLVNEDSAVWVQMEFRLARAVFLSQCGRFNQAADQLDQLAEKVFQTIHKGEVFGYMPSISFRHAEKVVIKNLLAANEDQLAEDVYRNGLRARSDWLPENDAENAMAMIDFAKTLRDWERDEDAVALLEDAHRILAQNNLSQVQLRTNVIQSLRELHSDLGNLDELKKWDARLAQQDRT